MHEPTSLSDCITGFATLPKSSQSARVRQLGPLVDDFRRRYPGPQARDTFIFLGDDKATPPDERDLLRYELRPVLKKLKIYYSGFGWHAFRRQNITWRQQAGATPFEAQKSAGHAQPNMTFQYTLTDAERERDQVGRMFDRLMELERGKPH